MKTTSAISDILVSAKPAELVELEQQLCEAMQKHQSVYKRIEPLREKTNPQIHTPLAPKTDATIEAAEKMIAELEATQSALSRTADEIQSKISTIKPAYTAAVAAKLAPIRSRAANDILLAVGTLYSAIEIFNASSDALKQSGTVTVLAIPKRFEVLDHFIAKIERL
ncbi:hypothetical protein IVB22_33200 [Bradyrhizobium sp. 190]|uniref:hypothetical protein n=1 Tax=Bradyrhizobium sp. 190 TaxID=2782658 RepID=UPI001FFA47CE|nr:hypothetical protein [Bradyrhizobium sp. 190]MCK1517278.1 hypothetical protein [Bradyrhizobium sp. 190]